MKKEQKTLSFEDELGRLQEITAALEEGTLPLEEALKLYEEGMKLVQSAQKRLNEAELRIKKVSESKNGELAIEEFPHNEEGTLF